MSTDLTLISAEASHQAISILSEDDNTFIGLDNKVTFEASHQAISILSEDDYTFIGLDDLRQSFGSARLQKTADTSHEPTNEFQENEGDDDSFIGRLDLSAVLDDFVHEGDEEPGNWFLEFDESLDFADALDDSFELSTSAESDSYFYKEPDFEVPDQ